jgi:hypothetical protein
MKTQIKQSLKLTTMVSKIILIQAIAIIFSIATLKASQPSPDTVPFQLTLITPLGTNGIEAPNKTNKVSINLFGGYNGGLNGVEISGFVGVLTQNMQGVQLSGFVNANLGHTKGVQGSGFVNYSHKSFSGFQGAGFANASLTQTKGVQLAGMANMALGSEQTVQLAGFTNLSIGSSASQLSGFANLHVGNLKGLQASSFLNVNTGTLSGMQLSALVNYTTKLRGLQLGVFNYVDSLERGLPIGIISVVRNGYRSIELKGTETLFGIGTFKTGVSQFYNIISVGAGYRNETQLWAFGYGVGTQMDLSLKNTLAIDLECFQVHQQTNGEHPLNLLNKLTVKASHQMGAKTALFAGASCNVVVSDTQYNGESFTSAIAPYSWFNKVYNNQTRVQIYPGFTAGIRF